MTVKMHHRNNQNFTALDRVNDSIGKAVCPATSNPFVQREPRRRVDENAPDGITDFLKKIKSKPRNAVFIVFRGFPQFPRRRRRSRNFIAAIHLQWPATPLRH